MTTQPPERRLVTEATLPDRVDQALTNPDSPAHASLLGTIEAAMDEFDPGSTVQVDVLELPADPTVGKAVTVLADPTTVFPPDVTWDIGGEPVVTARLLVTFIWSGDHWYGTYGLPIFDEVPDLTPPVWDATLTTATPSATSVTVTSTALSPDAASYEASHDGGTTWTPVVPAGLVFTLTDLTPSTTYPAPQFRALSAAAVPSAPLTAQAFTTPSSVPALADAIMDLTPVAYWKLNETSGTQAVDSSGNGHHGTYEGLVALAGKDGHAVFEDGRVAIPPAPEWAADQPGGFSVFAVHSTTQSGRAAVVGRSATRGKYEWQLGQSDIGLSDFLVFTANGSLTMGERRRFNRKPAGEWRATAATVPDIVHGGSFPLYFDDDGVQTKVTVGPAATYVARPDNPVHIGNRPHGDLPWAGAIAHVAIFHSVLTAEQVDTLMAAARAEGLIL